VAGAIATVVGSLLPWASFFFGYPGKMTLAGFPGGARTFTLVLALVGALAVADVPGRRPAGLVGAWGALAIAAGNLVAIANQGGGLGALAPGMWVTVAGAVLLVAGFLVLPDGAEGTAAGAGVRLPAPVELVAVAASLGLVLYTLVWGLGVDESNRFVSYLAFVGVVAAVLHRLGVLAALRSMFERHRTVAVAAAALTAVAFPFTQHGDAYWLRVFSSVGVFAAAAIGLNVVVGLAGLLDLGYIAFFGVGAYVGGLFANAGLTTVHVHLPFIVVVLIGACVSALFGVVIGAPTLRLRGDYLAIVTLGFGEIFRITANQWDGLTRGPNGIANIPDLKVRSLDFGEVHRILGVALPSFANYYFVELVLLAFAVLAFTRLNDSRIGRAWVAIREDEVAAAAMGVDTTRLKLLAFAIGAFLAGAAGTVNAHVGHQVSPDSYTFLDSVLLLAAVVLGGMGTVPGALLGSTALLVIPEKLRSFQDKRLMLFGAVLVLMMRFRPEGIVASRRRQRELRETDGRAGAQGTVPGAPVAPS
jgi:branched-chain amino acid transport system permease protein